MHPLPSPWRRENAPLKYFDVLTTPHWAPRDRTDHRAYPLGAIFVHPPSSRIIPKTRGTLAGRPLPVDLWVDRSEHRSGLVVCLARVFAEPVERGRAFDAHLAVVAEQGTVPEASLGTTRTSPSTRRRSLESTISMTQEALGGKDLEAMAMAMASEGVGRGVVGIMVVVGRRSLGRE